jgi:hypothetical protein
MVRTIRLDRELCFKKWVELGMQKNVAKWFYDQGIVSPTGKPYSRAAISYAARRWVCFNADEALEYYNRFGWYPDKDTWERWLVRTALKCFHSHNNEVFEEFLDKNGLREKYGYIIGEGEKP